MKLSRKLAALAMAVLLAVSLTACSPKQVAQDMVVHLVHKLGLVEESDEDDTDTTTKAPAGGSVGFPAEVDTTPAWTPHKLQVKRGPFSLRPLSRHRATSWGR